MTKMKVSAVTFEKRRPDSTATEILFENQLDNADNRVLLEISGVTFNIQGKGLETRNIEKLKLREKTEQVAKIAAWESGAPRKVPRPEYTVIRTEQESGGNDQPVL